MLAAPEVNICVFLCAGERPFKCESCNYLAANQHEVTRHARQVHNGPKPLSCPYCDYKTADRSNYKKHVELHLNPRQFLCPLCKYAASKKCNLQYHIKSRHAGCDVAMDISKVKLRVKKAGEHKLNGTSNAQEDLDVDGDSRDKGVEANPINLSIRRSGRPGTSQSAQSDAADKLQEKSCPPPDREKPGRARDQEKRPPTRQKVRRAQERGPEEDVQPGSTTASKARTKVRRLQAERTPAEAEQTLRPGKENQSAPTSRRTKRAPHRSRRAGPQQPERASRQAEHSQQGADGQQPSPEKKPAKEKAPKRRAEALDLSPQDRTPKTRRTKAAERLHPAPEETAQDGSAVTAKKKSRTLTGRQDSLSVHSRVSRTPGGPAPLHPSETVSKAETSPAKEGPPGPAGVEEPGEARDRPPAAASPGTPVDTSQKDVCAAEPHNTEDKAPSPSSPPAPDPPADPAEPAVHGPARQLEDSSQDASQPRPAEQSKGSDPEEDEGIHSSQEGGSDISDSASEGSEDSGLNSNGTGSGKLPNDPETPTEDIPAPTQLRGHTCIFCDRAFPLEAAYRRHLHRHLVNVYYMDAPSAQK